MFQSRLLEMAISSIVSAHIALRFIISLATVLTLQKSIHPIPIASRISAPLPQPMQRILTAKPMTASLQMAISMLVGAMIFPPHHVLITASPAALPLTKITTQQKAAAYISGMIAVAQKNKTLNLQRNCTPSNITTTKTFGPIYCINRLISALSRRNNGFANCSYA